MSKILLILFFVFSLFFLASTTPVSASHTWGNYHWSRTANPFNLKLGDNLSSTWDPYLATTSLDWSQSSVLDTTIVPGNINPRRCKATNGRVEICNASYGFSGWLGMAQIWVNGDHIYQGLTKLNDSYFNTSTYNKPAWRNLVMCQEVGHNFGLDHQDEDFNNAPLGTCMDYTSDPTPNQHPNSHDYEELSIIYSHLDNTTTIGQSTGSIFGWGRAQQDTFDTPSEWGKQLRKNGRSAIFERDLGGGHKLFTFVFLTEE